MTHFKAAKEDENRDKSEKALYEGLLKKITSADFVLDLGLMCDALQELSELSVELQACDITLHTAHRSISRQIKLFEDRRMNSGPYYREGVRAVEDLNFKGVTLEKRINRSNANHSLDPKLFYDSLKQ